MSTKFCKKCNLEKNLNEFHKDSANLDGHNYLCKNCLKEYSYQYRLKKNGPPKRRNIEYSDDGKKRCNKCDSFKDTSEFGKYTAAKDGLYLWCKECANKNKNQNKLDLYETRTTIIPEIKLCSSCNVEKSNTEFFKSKYSKDGLGSYCKSCDKKRKTKNVEKIKKIKKITPEFKICRRCKIEKKNTEFYKANTAKDGLNKYCIDCIKAENKKTWKSYTDTIENYVPKEITEESIREKIKDRDIELIKFDIGKRRSSIWFCKKCKTEFINTTNHIVNRNQGCPGCTPNSKLEKFVNQILVENNIQLEKFVNQILVENNIQLEKRYLTLHTLARQTNRAIVDFRFTINNQIYIIEVHGRQHYQYTEFFHRGKIQNFHIQQRRDRALIEYCDMNNMIYIEYNEDIGRDKIKEHILSIINKDK